MKSYADYYPRLQRKIRPSRRSRKLRTTSGYAVRYIYCITLTSLVVPEWAYPLQPLGFDREPQRVWLRRQIGSFLMQLDREDGGTPSIVKTPYRRCQKCNSIRLGLQALKQETCNCASR